MYISSNGRENYVKEVACKKEIYSFFNAIYTAGEFQTSRKEDLVGLLLNGKN
ncbi:hypothetical protein skT53_23570 [Effusibacillus dendaii]|uniref:Uncharacterized protein n=1 Tax=Effusibacillus dendaii TaxID=2743772 RepID=A0A7I8DDM3_9BACL|nr:hypothetical protein skT53_23570 [Effusibacillus dendaii]